MTKRLGIAGIVLLAAFGLAACGGGGGGTATMQGPTQAEQLATLQGQINALRAQLGLEDDGDVGAGIKALQNERDRLQDLVDDAADKAADAKRKADRATAAKLYAGISAPTGDVGSPTATDRAAAYNTANTAIMVSAGVPADTPAAVTLSENKKAMVAANHGWAGKMYADPAGGDSYEAVVYSNVEAPKAGKKFGTADAITATSDYQYQLTGGSLSESLTEGDTTLVGGLSFDQSAGVKSYPLGANNVAVKIPGTFHGVSGTYSCTPSATTVRCASQVAEEGFTLGQVTVPTDSTAPLFTAGDGTWTFMPADPNARVLNALDTAYASYGWWLRKSADGTTYTASAFVDEKGDVPAASGLNALNGTARYVGGAAGKYALTSATGGTNDAGHFTARATLEANFTTNTASNAITGTIDMFDGADGKRRDWEVTLNGSPIGDTGAVGNADDGTVWTIGGTAGAADGSWSGTLRNNGADGVPQVATGTFHSTYGTGGGEGSMVGAFGANKYEK